MMETKGIVMPTSLPPMGISPPVGMLPPPMGIPPLGMMSNTNNGALPPHFSQNIANFAQTKEK